MSQDPEHIPMSDVEAEAEKNNELDWLKVMLNSSSCHDRWPQTGVLRTMYSHRCEGQKSEVKKLEEPWFPLERVTAESSFPAS